MALLVCCCFGVMVTLGMQPAQSQSGYLAKGTGGAVASGDALATQIGIDVMTAGGNAVDAAVATAAALGIVEPFASGIGGGGFMVIYRPDASQPNQASVITLDGREKAPAATTPDLFRDPDSPTGEPLPFFPNRISSGLGVGIPGTPLNWATAVERYGSRPLAELLQPALALAETGFVVDEAFVEQIKQHQDRFAAFSSTRSLYLPNGNLPPIGSRLRNPDLAKSYQLLAEEGVNAFYRGEMGQAIVQTVQQPPVVAESPFKVWPGRMTLADMDQYEVRVRPATESTYRGNRFYGMGLPSSGGITVAQTLNLLEGYNLSDMSPAQVLHLLIEAERLAFADRGVYLGDPEYVDVPVVGLLNKQYADERRSEIPERAPNNESDYRAIAGNPLPYQQDPSPSLSTPPTVAATTDTEGMSTTHLTVADSNGMVVSYTLTIESTGGSGMVVPGYGFILNNELTDFDVSVPHPNVPEPGKRPRSSMAPTITVEPDGSVFAFGSPGGSTIITTVLNMVIDRFDLGLSLEESVSGPRLSQRNRGITEVDLGFENTEIGKALTAEYGHQLVPDDDIGAVTGIVMTPEREMYVIAEPARRGGGSAMTVR
ncbi:MAG: gamma-glutamyltransferase [Cyanobacteria bacterium P01_F01_bin.53]